MRINRYIADLGICSRRNADELILNKRVTVNGKIALLGTIITDDDEVLLDGKPLKKVICDLPVAPYGKAKAPELNAGRKIYIALHKPLGVVCTTDKKEKNNISDYMNFPVRIYPIGRLDKASTGLILLTNDGSIVNRILRSSNHHEKEYIVKVDKPLNPDDLKKMSKGVPILDTVTLPCSIKQIDQFTFNIILTQGLNRQIRRMCEYFDYRVKSLVRVRIMNISLGKIPYGSWRYLSIPELEQLENLL